MHKMQTDEFWRLLRVEMTAHSVAHLCAQLVLILGFDENFPACRACDETAFRRLLDDKNDFGVNGESCAFNRPYEGV